MNAPIEVTCALDVRAALGECPVWCGREKRLYWIDIRGKTLNRFDPLGGGNEVRELPEEIGSFGLRESGGIVAAMRTGFYFLDFDTGERTPIIDPEPDQPDNRLNDGRCDPAGRFWAGSMADPMRPGQRLGSLYRLDTDRTCARLFGDIGVSNGLAFSPDASTLYFADTVTERQTIWAFDFDLDTGHIDNRRVFATTHDLPGRPDGGCVDEEGGYWSANVDGWQLVRYTPDGRIDRTLPVPVQKPSMCAFGGDDLEVLFITTISAGSTTPLTAGQPQAGSLFACRPGVRGLPEPRFAG